MFKDINWVFTIFSLITIFCALTVVTSRNPIHSVLALILCFFSISAHYVLLNAQFLAIVNLIVYAGAIMVLFLFVLMLLNLNKETEPHKSKAWFYAAAVSAGMLMLIMAAALRTSSDLIPKNVQPNTGLVKNLGQVLFSDYLVPFELSGVLFISAMVGAVFLGKRDNEKSSTEKMEVIK